MILRSFRELDAKCLHPEPSLRKIREADGDNLGLRILRGKLPVILIVIKTESTRGPLEKEEEGGERRVQDGQWGPRQRLL